MKLIREAGPWINGRVPIAFSVDVSVDFVEAAKLIFCGTDLLFPSLLKDVRGRNFSKPVVGLIEE
jgi:hypothetical protein